MMTPAKHEPRLEPTITYADPDGSGDKLIVWPAASDDGLPCIQIAPEDDAVQALILNFRPEDAPKIIAGILAAAQKR